MFEFGGCEEGSDEGVAGGEIGDGGERGRGVKADGGGGKEGWEE